MPGKNDPMKFEIISQIGIVSTSKTGWQTEVNRVSWNDGIPKYDIRTWSPDHTKMGKGITLTDEELEKLSAILADEVAFLQNE